MATIDLVKKLAFYTEGALCEVVPDQRGLVGGKPILGAPPDRQACPPGRRRQRYRICNLGAPVQSKSARLDATRSGFQFRLARMRIRMRRNEGPHPCAGGGLAIPVYRHEHRAWLHGVG